MNLKNQKLVSVVIPVYNDFKYLEKCLNSIRCQTYSQIEIICVDDVSEDGSWEYLLAISQKDTRIKPMRLAEHSEAFTARKKGVEKAEGDFLFFVDADDYVTPGLINELLELQEVYSADIMHFSSTIINCGISKATQEDMVKFALPFYGELYNNDIFEKCFCAAKYGFNLWNKLFTAKLCKDVFLHIPDVKIPKANDLFSYFFLALKADSYIGIKTENKYCYCYGNGDTSKMDINIRDFQRYCSYGNTCSLMETMSADWKAASLDLQMALDRLKYRFAEEIVNVWINYLSKQYKPQGFDIMMKSYDKAYLIHSLHLFMEGRETEYAKLLYNCESLKKSPLRQNKKVAFYYCRFGKGGVERVISHLIPLFIKGGMEVILITDTFPQEEDYKLPEGVRRYVIPSEREVIEKRIPLKEREQELERILRQEQVECLCYQAASSELLLYDLLMARLNAVDFIVTKHEMFSAYMIFNRDVLSYEIAVYPLVSKLTVLSHTEKAFWKIFGIEAYYVPNPFDETICIEENPLDKNNIVWVGRLCFWQKRYQDLVPIMKKVVKAVPDCVLKIYGSTENDEDILQLNRQIKANGMENSIIYCGYTTDVNEIYKDAGIHLVTSSYEAFPMSIFESRQFGLPLVNYDMPYLEMLKDDKGYIAVEQGDCEGAAAAIIELLNNEELRRQKGAEAKESIKDFNNESLLRRWEGLLWNIDRVDIQMTDNPNEIKTYMDIIKTMIFHDSLGCSQAKSEKQEILKLAHREKCVYEISLKCMEKNLGVVLYPYGHIGRQTRKLLEENGVKISFIIDNHLSETDKTVKSVRDLETVDSSSFLFVICSDNILLYDELRDAIYQYVPQENIYDMFPKKTQ